MIEAAREGRSAALLVHGEAGMGKTSLLRDAGEQATGLRVLRARGIESESHLPFAALPGGRSGVVVLGITATRPGAAVWTRGGWLGRLNRRTTPYEVSFKAAAFAGEAEAILRVIKRYQGDARRRRSIASEEELARVLRELGKSPARA